MPESTRARCGHMYCPSRTRVQGDRVNPGFSLVDQGACPTRSDKGFDTISKN